MKNQMNFFVAGLLCFLVLIAPDVNYSLALNAAKQSEGTDSAIENAMYSFGFNLDACDPIDPSYGEKWVAMFNRITNL